MALLGLLGLAWGVRVLFPRPRAARSSWGTPDALNGGEGSAWSSSMLSTILSASRLTSIVRDIGISVEGVRDDALQLLDAPPDAAGVDVVGGDAVGLAELVRVGCEVFGLAAGHGFFEPFQEVGELAEPNAAIFVGPAAGFLGLGLDAVELGQSL